MYQRLITSFLLTIALLMSAGCQKKQTTEIFHVGTNIWPGYEPLHLAKAQGLYKQAIEVKSYGSTTEVLKLFRQGEIQAAAVTLDETILLKDQGYSPVVIAVLDISDGADVILSKPEIKSLAALKGKTIGVENSALGSYVMTRALKIGGLTYDDVEILPVTVDEHEAVFNQNVVDAVVTFEPVRSALLKNGANEIFTSKEIPNEIVDVLIVKEAYASSVYVDDLLKGWSKAAQGIITNDPETIKLASQRHNQSPDEFLLSLDGLKIPTREENDAMFNNHTMITTIKKIQEVMLAKNLIQTPFNPKEILPK